MRSDQSLTHSGHRSILLLDNIRSAHNVGAIFRLADAFALQELWLCGITAQPPHPPITKSALGAEKTVPWRYFNDYEPLFEAIAQQKRPLIAIEQDPKATPLHTFHNHPLHKKQAHILVVGHELYGIHNTLLKHADLILEIPQYGKKHSLNVATAAAIALWELCKSTSSSMGLL